MGHAQQSADDAVYYESIHEKLIIDKNLKITSEKKERLHFNESNHIYSQKSIYYTQFDKVISINGYTESLNAKGKLKQYPIEGIQTNDVMVRGIFHSGTKRKKFTFSNIEKGARTFLNVKIEKTDPHFLNPVNFQQVIPVKKFVYTIVYPDHVNLDFRVFGDSIRDLTFVRKKDNLGNHIIEWTAKDISPPYFEEGAPRKSYYAFHIIPFIKSYYANGNKINVLESIQDLYAWYAEFINQIPNNQLSQSVKDIIDSELIVNENPKKTTLNIFNWVQNHIRYIAFESGMEGFIPRSSNSVCEKKYGDCKDMSNLLVQMLKHADLKAYPTWIGTRHKPYAYTDLHTPMVDNHMIATIDLNDSLIFLDPTGRFVNLGYPTSMIQGKQALIGTSSDSYKLAKVPQIPADSNVLRYDLKMEIQDNNAVSGAANISISGIPKTHFDHHFVRAESDLEDVMLRFFNFNSDNLLLSSLQTKRVGVIDPSGQVSFDYSIKNYVKGFDGTLFVKPFLLANPLEVIKSERRLSLEQKYTYNYQYQMTFEIPQGYEIEFIPKDTRDSNELAAFHAQYSISQGVIELNLDIRCTTLMIEKAQFTKWNQIASALGKTIRSQIVLKKT